MDAATIAIIGTGSGIIFTVIGSVWKISGCMGKLEGRISSCEKEVAGTTLVLQTELANAKREFHDGIKETKQEVNEGIARLDRRMDNCFGKDKGNGKA